jgi:large subunit ribosomal protein L22
MKLSWLATLIRGAWVPDALAQLKFSPKHRAIDFAKMIQRAVAIARIHHDCIPEELFVKEVVVTKGICTRRMRIMGRGRVGIGYKRRAHVTIRLDRVDFDFKIKDSVDFNERGMWEKRQKWAEKKLKEKSDPDLSLKVM